jgi:polysaccharide biosynthesis protein PslG
MWLPLIRRHHPLVIAVIVVLASGFLWSESFAAAQPESAGDLGSSTHKITGGIAAGHTLYDLSGAAREQQLAAIRASGLRFVRTDLSWAQVQPHPGAFQWSQTDSFMAALASHHLDWLVILDYSAPWDESQPNAQDSPPAGLSNYLAYVRATARRYGRNGSFWRQHPHLPRLPVTTFEIWNEPNEAAFWQPAPDAEAYARLYLAARHVLHEVDPQVEVISGGLIPYPLQSSYAYIRAMFHAEPSLRRALDAFGWHPYAANAKEAMSQVRSVRAILREEGAPRVPIELTEFGWSTAGSSATPENMRTKDLSIFVHLVASSDCGVGLVSAYAWLTSEDSPASTEDWYGLANPNATLKPAGVSYTTAVREAAGRPETGTCR